MSRVFLFIIIFFTGLQSRAQFSGIWQVEQIKVGREKVVSNTGYPMAFLAFTDSTRVQIYESALLHNRTDSFLNFLYTSELKLNRRNNRIQFFNDSGLLVFKGIYKTQYTPNGMILLDDEGRTIKLKKINALPKENIQFKKSTTKIFTLLGDDTTGSALQEIYLIKNTGNRLVSLNKMAMFYVQLNTGQTFSVLGIVHHIDSTNNLMYVIPKTLSEHGHKNNLFKRVSISRVSNAPMIAIPVANIYRVAYYSRRATALKTTGAITCGFGGGMIQTAALIFAIESCCSSIGAPPIIEDDYVPLLTAGLVTSGTGLALMLGVSKKYEITSDPSIPNSWQFVYRDYLNSAP